MMEYKIYQGCLIVFILFMHVKVLLHDIKDTGLLFKYYIVHIIQEMLIHIEKYYE